jgi:hypothetical protein
MKLKIRLTGHVVEDYIRIPNKIWPAVDKLDYKVYLVAIQHVIPNKVWYHGFNFLFSNGTGTNYPPYGASPSDWSTVRLQDHHQDQVRKIRVHAYSGYSTVGMIKLFALDGTLLLTAGDWEGNVFKDFELQQGERIIGVHGYSPAGDQNANIQDIQFVIGRLEPDTGCSVFERH